jgi:hypothetical protein
MVNNKWWYFNKAIPEEDCKKIINLADWYSPAQLSEGGVHPKVRKCLSLGRRDQWLYDLFWPYMLGANKESGWKYDIQSAEDFQVLKYNKGDFYVTHEDGNGDHLSVYDMPDNKFFHNRVRKLSMVAFLNNDYGGGELEIDGKVPMTRETGNLVIFPSFISHQVKPVTSGERFSLSNWFLGPPFK